MLCRLCVRPSSQQSLLTGRIDYASFSCVLQDVGCGVPPLFSDPLLGLHMVSHTHTMYNTTALTFSDFPPKLGCGGSGRVSSHGLHSFMGYSSTALSCRLRCRHPLPADHRWCKLPACHHMFSAFTSSFPRACELHNGHNCPPVLSSARTMGQQPLPTTKTHRSGSSTRVQIPHVPASGADRVNKGFAALAWKRIM